MKKILIILFCLPLFVLGQDLPTNNSTTKLKITNEKTRAKLKKKIEKDHKKSLKMKPKGQLGYIVGPEGSPWGGISWFLHGKSIGAYIDWRPSGNWLHSDNFTGIGDVNESEYVVFNQTLWTSVTNYGLSFKIYSSSKTAIMIYAGYGTTNTKTYSGVDPLIESGFSNRNRVYYYIVSPYIT